MPTFRGLVSEDQLLQLITDWDTDYKDAAYKYKESHIKVETTKAAVDDLARYGSALDRTVIAFAPTSAAPAWFYGIFLILFFAFVIPLLPPGGMVTAASSSLAPTSSPTL